MDEAELESTRQKRLQKRMHEMQARQEQDERLRAVLRQILEEPAYERMANVRISNPELYMRAAQALASAASSGRITRKVSEMQLRAVLEQLSQKRETKIEFKQK